jgi:hypothetical protein
MKPKKIIASLFILTIVSCQNRVNPVHPIDNTPKALEENNASFRVLSKSGQEDIIENLYIELLNKDTVLKTLETQLDDLYKTKGDSTGEFDRFNEKNLQYYNSTDRMVSGIKDSVFRDQLKIILADELSKYNNIISKHKALMDTIDKNQTTISDLHKGLKIVKTLALIQEFQKNRLPVTKSLEDFSRRQSALIRLEDSLLKK